MCGNLAGCVGCPEQELTILLVVVLGLLDGSPHREGAVSEAGSLVHPVEFACGVREEVASQGARRAARPRRVPLWDEALLEEAEVHNPCGSTRGREPPRGGGEEVACGGGGRTVALQKSRWAVKPHRTKLWENAEEVEGGPAGSALAVVLGGAIAPNCAGGVSNLTTVLRQPPMRGVASWWCGSFPSAREEPQRCGRAGRAGKQGSAGKSKRPQGWRTRVVER